MGSRAHNGKSECAQMMEKRLTVLVLFCLSITLLSGFSFSNPSKLKEEIKEEIKKELEKIVEKTPSAKLRNRWRITRDEANSVLEKALLLSAPRFCPKEWDEAVGLFKRAKGYAFKREYRKAIYLAKLTKKSGQKTVDCAQGYLDSQTRALLKTYERLRERMDEIRAMVPTGAEELTIQANDLSLEVEDLKIAIDLRQFKDAKAIIRHLEQEMPRLEATIKEYRKNNMEEEDSDVGGVVVQ